MKARVKTHCDEYTAKQYKYPIVTLLEAHKRFYKCRQLPGQSVADYAKCLTDCAETINALGSTVCDNYTIVPETDEDGALRSLETRQKMAVDYFMATALLCGADSSRYESLSIQLANRYLMGVDEYPKDMVSAQRLLVMYKDRKSVV